VEQDGDAPVPRQGRPLPRGRDDVGRDASGRIGVQLTMFDEGNGDRAVTSAAFVFGPARA
jgi:hypothetical protein